MASPAVTRWLPPGAAPTKPLGRGIPAPTPPVLSSGASAPGAPTPGVSTFGSGNNLISSQIATAPSARTTQYGAMTDQAAQGATGYDRSGAQQGATERYRSLYGTGQTGYTPTNTQLASQGVNTQVGYSPAETQVHYTPAETDQRYRPVGTDVGYSRLGTDVGYRPAETAVAGGPAVGPQDSAELTRFRGLLSGSADALSALPDRYKTAQEQFDNFVTATNPSYKASLEDATKLGAANGILQSGMLSDRYGTIAEQRARDMDTQRNSFLADALDKSIDDRYRSLSAFQGLTGDTAAQEAGRRGEQRTERQYTTDLDTQNLGRATSERNYQTALDEANLGRQGQERAYGDTLSAQNLARQAAERDTEASTDAQNLARRATERNYAGTVAADNLARGAQERTYATDLAERNAGRAAQERNYQDTVATGNLDRATTERNFASGIDRSNADAAFARTQAAVGQGATDADRGVNDRYRALDAASSLENQFYNRDVNEATNLRGERDYQYGVSKDAQQSAIQQYLAQLAAQDQQFRQGATLDQLGNKNNANALSAYGNAANLYGNDAASAFGALGTAQNQAGQASSQEQQRQLLQQILDAIAAKGGA